MATRQQDTENSADMLLIFFIIPAAISVAVLMAAYRLIFN